MKLPNPYNLMLTRGVLKLLGESKDDLLQVILQEFVTQPNDCFDGGNDKYFFTVMFNDTKLFVAANELNGLTVMLPEEY